MTNCCTIIATTSTIEEADKIAQILLENRVVACVQQLPIKSAYHWQGKIEQANEIMLVMKTQSHHFNKVKKLIQDNHSYEVPEIVMLPIEKGLNEYLSWVVKETS